MDWKWIERFTGSEEKKPDFVGGTVTAKEKGRWFYVREEGRLHASQKKPRISVGHLRFRGLWFKEKEDLKAAQGKEGRNMSYIVSHITLFLAMTRVIWFCNYISLWGLHKHKISTMWEIWSKVRMNYCILLGLLSPESDFSSSRVAI